MKTYLDLTTILKDCPKGMELDCTMYDNVTLESVSNDTDNSYPICIKTKCGFSIRLTKYGQNVCLDDAKCVIFPKGKTTWEGFVPPCNFKDGDILSYQNKSYKKRTIYIYKYHSKMNTSYYVALSGCPDSNFLINNGRDDALDNYNDTVRFATEEEKKKLFQAIKDKGYNWNEETKTLEKLIVPKFKVGDIIRYAGEKTQIKIIDIKNNQYHIECFCDKYNEYKNGIIPISEQNNYILIPRFDPKTLQSFDKVLVRDREQGDWRINMNKILDLTKILKDCPKGTEFYSRCLGVVKFESINDALKCIILKNQNETVYYKETGVYYYADENAEIDLFPSKDQRDWSKWHRPFKNGDIVYLDFGHYYIITIFKRQFREFLHYHASLRDNNVLSINVNNSLICTSYLKEIRFATEEEKQKLFNAIEANGYRLNAETNTLEKLIEPRTFEKFYIRIGDIPSEENSAVYRGDIVVGYEDGVSVYDCVEIDGLYRIIMPFPLKEGQGMTYESLIQEITQCRYKIENPRNIYLVSGIEVGKGHDNEPLIKEVKILKDLTGQFNTKSDNIEKNKTLEKLIVPKFKIGDTIRSKTDNNDKFTITNIDNNEFYYGCEKGHEFMIPVVKQDNWELISNKFDPKTFKPFDKVLVKQCDDFDPWCVDFYSYYDEDEGYVICTGDIRYDFCVPYNDDTKHLVGKFDDAPEFYRYWEK